MGLIRWDLSKVERSVAVGNDVCTNCLVIGNKDLACIVLQDMGVCSQPPPNVHSETTCASDPSCLQNT